MNHQLERTTSMRYLLAIYDTEGNWESLSRAQQQKDTAEYMAISSDLRAAGKYLGGAPLQPVTTASTVRVRDGKAVVTDGPFAETREQLGGFYLIDAESLDAALAVAARIPATRTGCVEVRPVMEIPGA
jgi:hypothetical protein